MTLDELLRTLRRQRIDDRYLAALDADHDHDHDNDRDNDRDHDNDHDHDNEVSKCVADWRFGTHRLGRYPVVARGEVRWLALDTTRPVVLLNRSAVIDRLSSVLVAPCTTRQRGLPTEVRLDEREGMPAACVVSLDNVTLVERSLLGSVIASLSAERMDAVCSALALAVGCDQ
ncbi:hypothetical protein BH10ACT2_BH10ACT2_04990 [soil metagenome]